MDLCLRRVWRFCCLFGMRFVFKLRFFNMEGKFKLVVLGLIENSNNEFLLSQRFEPILPEVHLKWDLPGGKNEFGESLDETIIREIKEETGLEVKIARFMPFTVSKVWDYKDCKQHTIVFCFHCLYLNGELNSTDSKINDLKWVAKNDLLKYDFLETTKSFIDNFLSSQ